MSNLVQLHIFLLLVTLCFESSAQEGFSIGTPLRNAAEFTHAQKLKIWDLEDLAIQVDPQTSIRSVEAYITLGNNETYAVIDKGLVLAEIDLSTGSVIGPWPLTRWSHQIYSTNVAQNAAELGLSYPLPYSQSEFFHPGKGCIGNAPLRYGDLDGDNNNELVVLVGDLFVVFSPQYNRTVFAFPIDDSDWMDEEAMNSYYPESRYPEGTPGSFQYLSGLLADNNSLGVGIRSYAKMYVGNYDGDMHPDILIWRKEYRSNLKSDTTPGFTKIADDVFHYERDLESQADSAVGVTGEYLPQGTDETTVRDWLAVNNQTWLTGYPSESECPGKEGQLIPEMHDPLLNDPEVLPPVATPTPALTP